MTTKIAMEALSELSEKINNYEFDPAKRTYYGLAIDTAVKELVNYERLIEEMLNYQQQSYVNLGQQQIIQALRYNLFREGEDVP